MKKPALKILIPAVLLIMLPLSVSAAQNSNLVEIHNLRSFTHPSHTRIVVDIGILREYSPHELRSPDRIYVDILQVRLNPILHEKTILVGNGYLKQIRIAQRTPTSVRIVADIDSAKVKRFHVFHLFNPFRVVIDIYPHKSTSPENQANEMAKTDIPARPTKDGYSLARQLGLGIRRIVIDPGHGGGDPGCIGRKGLKEKTVVLDVCQRLKRLLETQTELEVIVTRDSDIRIPLENRTVIANQKQADLFISVHANANEKRSLSGVQTFYLNFSQDPMVNQIAARENATSTKNIGQMKDIIEKIVKNSKILESREMAKTIQESLVKRLRKTYKNVTDRGVKGGPFWVLIGGEMPSVLVEISHLSNAMEEQRLGNPQYRQNIAQGIFEGIMKYIRSLGKG